MYENMNKNDIPYMDIGQYGEIIKNCIIARKFIVEHLGGKRADAENIANVLSEYLTGMDKDVILRDCGILKQGLEHGAELFTSAMESNPKAVIRKIIQENTKGMDPEQRRGYLEDMADAIYISTENKELTGKEMHNWSSLNDNELFKKTVEAASSGLSIMGGKSLSDALDAYSDLLMDEDFDYFNRNVSMSAESDARMILAAALYASGLSKEGFVEDSEKYAQFIGESIGVQTEGFDALFSISDDNAEKREKMNAILFNIVSSIMVIAAMLGFTWIGFKLSFLIPASGPLILFIMGTLTWVALLFVVVEAMTIGLDALADVCENVIRNITDNKYPELRKIYASVNRGVIEVEEAGESFVKDTVSNETDSEVNKDKDYEKIYSGFDDEEESLTDKIFGYEV